MIRVTARRALSWPVVSRLLALTLVALVAQRSLPALRRELARYQVAAVAVTQTPGVLPPGRIVVSERIHPSRVVAGDVIVYHQPLRERFPLHARVAHIEPLPGGPGYLVRLDVGDSSGEPWFAELYAGAQRVVFDLPAPPPVFGSVGGPSRTAVGVLVAVVAGGGLAGVLWYRTRSLVVRSSRTHAPRTAPR